MTHESAFQLLPWYLNGTLGASDRRAVAAHLAGCAGCAAELRLLERIQPELANLAAAMPAPPVAERLDGVLARVRSVPVIPIEAAPSRRRWWGRLPGYAKLALAAELLMVVGLGAWAVSLSRDRGSTTAGGGGDQASRARIAIEFQGGVSEAALRATVQAVGGTIVAGPSALGLYTVALELPADSVAATERVVARLSRDTSVIRSVARAP